MATSTDRPATPKKGGGFTHLWILIGITIVLAVITAALGVQLKVPGFLGTRATLGAGLNVIAQLIMLATLWYGRSLAKKKDFYRHKRVQTSVMLFNLVAIGFVMIVTFREQIVGPGAAPGDPVIPLAIGHGISGGLLELLGLYIVFRMWFEKQLPEWIKFKNFKLLMQITIYGWTLVTIGGVAIFAVRYFVSAPAAPVAVVTATPTAPPAETPEPTALPPAPTATPTEVTGLAAVDDDRAFSDRLNIDLFNVPPPPPGSVYEGWLIGNNGEFRLSVGVLEVGPDGHISQQFTSPIGENLLAIYNEFILTLEPVGDTDGQPSADIKFSAVVPPQAGLALRVMLATVSDTPDNVGYLLGLRTQAEVVASHVSLTDLALGPQDLVGVHRHAEHLINAIEGLHGEHFGDADGDGRILNPGDGYGLLSTSQGPGYIESVIQHAQAAIDAPDATADIKLHAGHVLISAQNTQTWVEQINVKALELVQAQDIDTARALFEEMRVLADNMLNGVDANGDGEVGPIPGEGTILTAYQHAQFAASPAYQSPLQEGGAPLAVAQATPTPTPPPPTATPTPEPQVVQVLMKDFAFGPPTITVKAGTTVEFINLDNAPHTATTDDNSQDTGTLNLNNKASLTFDQPGEFPYFCLFHGGPGGVGMAGQIVVEP